MIIGVCEGLRGEEVFLTSMKGTLNFWEETRKRYLSHTMVTLKGWFKGKTGEKWHMLPLLDITESGIEVRKRVGIWLEVLVEEDGKLEGWVFQIEGGERLRIHDKEEGFKEGFRELHAIGEGLIPSVVDIV